MLVGDDILLLEFFVSCSKSSDANIGIIANFVQYVKKLYCVH